MATNPAEQPSTEPTTDVTTPEPDAGADRPAEDDVKAKFLAALQRKNSKGGPGAGDGAEGGDKASGATTNHKVHREFRRKSGGG